MFEFPIIEFGWSASDHDKLAQGTLAGQLIECGAQGTGGLVTPATVAEQLPYEIGDPRAYLVPDVTCDFTDVNMTQDGEHRVRVTGAVGCAPTAHYKVSATFADGWRNTGFLTVGGEQAAAKTQRTGAALLTRMARMLEARGLPPFSATRIKVLGGEDMYGAHARSTAREVVLKIAARCASKESLELFAREFAPATTSMAPGTLGLVGGQPSPTRVVRLFSFLWPKADVTVEVDMQGERIAVTIPADSGFDAGTLPAAPRHSSAMPASSGSLSSQSPPQPTRTVPLIALAHGRSGDKGDTANIGIVARRVQDLPPLSAWLTPERVAAHFAHRAPRQVERFDLPGINAINFVLHGVLGGGGMASLHTDNLAKAYAQVLLAMDVEVEVEMPAP